MLQYGTFFMIFKCFSLVLIMQTCMRKHVFAGPNTQQRYHDYRLPLNQSMIMQSDQVMI